MSIKSPGQKPTSRPELLLAPTFKLFSLLTSKIATSWRLCRILEGKWVSALKAWGHLTAAGGQWRLRGSAGLCGPYGNTRCYASGGTSAPSIRGSPARSDNLGGRDHDATSWRCCGYVRAQGQRAWANSCTLAGEKGLPGPESAHSWPVTSALFVICEQGLIIILYIPAQPSDHTNLDEKHRTTI